MEYRASKFKLVIATTASMLILNKCQKNKNKKNLAPYYMGKQFGLNLEFVRSRDKSKFVSSSKFVFDSKLVFHSKFVFHSKLISI